MPELSQNLALEIGRLKTERGKYESMPEAGFAASSSQPYEVGNQKFYTPGEAKAATLAEFDRLIKEAENRAYERQAYEQTPAYAAEQRGFAEQELAKESAKVGYDVRDIGDIRQQMINNRENVGYIMPMFGVGPEGRQYTITEKTRVLEGPYLGPSVSNSYFVFDSDVRMPVVSLSGEQSKQLSPIFKSELEQYGVTYPEYKQAVSSYSPGPSSVFDIGLRSAGPMVDILGSIAKGKAPNFGDVSLTGLAATAQDVVAGLTNSRRETGYLTGQERAAIGQYVRQREVEDISKQYGIAKPGAAAAQFLIEQSPTKATVGGTLTGAYLGGAALGQVGALTTGFTAGNVAVARTARFIAENPKLTEAAAVTLFGVAPAAYSYGSTKYYGGTETQAQRAAIASGLEFGLGYKPFVAGMEASNRIPQLGFRAVTTPGEPVTAARVREFTAGGKPIAANRAVTALTLEYDVTAAGKPAFLGGQGTRREALVLVAKGEKGGLTFGKLPSYDNMPSIKTYGRNLPGPDVANLGPYQFAPSGPLEVKVLASQEGMAAAGFKPGERLAVKGFLDEATYAGAQAGKNVIDLPKRTKYLTEKQFGIIEDTLVSQRGKIDRLQGSTVFKQQLAGQKAPGKLSAKAAFRSPKDVDVVLKVGQEPAVFASQAAANLRAGGVKDVTVNQGQVLIKGNKAVEYIKPDVAASFLYGTPGPFMYGFRTPQKPITGFTSKGKALPVQRASEQLANYGGTVFGYYRSVKGQPTLGISPGREKDVEGLLAFFASNRRGPRTQQNTQNIREYAAKRGASFPKVNKVLGLKPEVSVSKTFKGPSFAASSFKSYAPTSFSSSKPSSSSYFSSSYAPSSSSGSKSSSSGSSSYYYGGSSSSSSSSSSSYSSSSSSSSSSSGSSSYYYSSSYSPSRSYSSYIYGPSTPRAPSGGGSGFGLPSFGGARRGSSKYVASLTAILGNVKSRKQGALTGFSIRPIVISSKKRRKRK